MTGRRRGLRRALVGIAIGLGVLVLLALAAFGFLFTDPGERLLKDRLVSAAEQSTGQRVQIARLEFHGDRLVLEQVKATNPAGQPTFGAERAEVDLALSTLLGRGVHLDRLALTNYRLQVRRAERQAPAPAAPSKEKKRPPGIAIDQLALDDGVIEVFEKGGGLQLKIERLGATGALAHRDRIWRGAIEIRGEVKTPAQVPLAISAAARAEGGLQTARIDAGSGESRLHLNLQLPVPDRSGKFQLAQVNGRLDLAIARFRNSGFQYGPVRAAAQFDNGRLHVQQLHLELPGLLATRDDSDAGAFSGTVKIADLATAIRAIEALADRSLPELSGQGELHLRLDNPITSAGLKVDGRMGALRWGELQGRELKFEGQLADLTDPSQGRLALEAASVKQGDRQLGAVKLKIRNEAKLGSLEATIAEPVPTTLQAAIEQPGRDQPMRLRQFVLSYPEATWRAEGGPARIRVTEEGIAIDALELVCEGQKIAVQGAWGSERKSLNLSLTALRLERLPPLLLPRTLHASGQVDGDLKVTAPGGRLAGTANLSVSQARLEGLTQLSARLAARFGGDRLEGTVTGSALEGTLAGRFDLPTSGAAKDRTLTAHLTLERASVAGVWGWAQGRLSKDLAGRVKDPAGRLSATVDVAGTLAEPRVKAQFAVDDGAITYPGAERFTALTVRGEAEASGDQLRLSNLLVRTGQGRLQVSGSARRAGPDRSYPYTLDVTAERFPLPFEEPMLATLKANVTGTAGPGRITSKVSVSNLRLEQVTKQPPSALNAL